MNEFARQGIRKDARKLVKGNLLSLYAANLIVQIMLGISVYLKDYIVLMVIVLIFTSVLEFGLAMFYLDFSKDKVINYKNIFISYKGKFIRFGKHLLTFIVKYFIILLSATLLLIPGLIKKYSYSQVKYLRASHPDMGVIRCLLVSKKMMKWHKLELFILDMTFILWFVAVPLTGGLILVYLLPYYNTTMGLYHHYLQGRYDLNKDINRGLIAYFVYYIYKIR